MRDDCVTNTITLSETTNFRVHLAQVLEEMDVFASMRLKMVALNVFFLGSAGCWTLFEYDVILAFCLTVTNASS